MQQSQDDSQRAWVRIVAKCWSDPKFKERLKNDPVGTLAAEGIALPEGLHFQVHEDTKETHHLSIPEQPSGELSEDMLEDIAAGAISPFLFAGGDVE